MVAMKKGLVYGVIAVFLLSMLYLTPPGLAQMPPPLSLAPLNPAFLQYLQDLQAGNVKMQTEEGYSLGHMPPPLDLSHTKGQKAPQAQPMSLPAYYDLRTLGKVTSVKDQNYPSSCGSCWAHATYASLESYLLTGETWDFSEQNLKNTHGFDWGHCSGGTRLVSTAYLARYSGPIDEADDPYNSNTNISPPGLIPKKHIQEVIFLPERTGPLDNDVIKQAVMDHGAIDTSFYWTSSGWNETYYSFYTTIEDANHSVGIVGWDDNFAASKFKTPPPGNGAWIIKNSWGTGWGESGYFYMSYYTPICENTSFHNAESTTNYADTIYQYDPLGWVDGVGLSSNTLWGANIFTSNSTSSLKALSFYTASVNSSYNIYIYKNVTTGPTTGTLAGSKTGTITWPGYHTIPLSSAIPLNTGQKFSVVVKFKTPGFNYPVPVEYVISGYSSGATANPGESYYSSNGTSWSDLTGWDPTANVCIKAFANYVPTPPSAPILSFPQNNATDICPLTNLTFDWNNSSGTPPITYQIQLSSNSGFTSIVFDQSGLTTTDYTYPGSLNSNTQYWWRVRASNTVGTSNWATDSFTTDSTCPLILLVDDDNGSSYEIFFQNALIDNGFSYNDWNVASQGSPTSSTLARYPIVIWFTGNDYSQTLLTADRINLKAYLDSGGKLFLTGQDIGYDLADKDEGNYDPVWYQNYLHATFIQDDTDIGVLNGVVGDPISDGMYLTIAGGDGADNQEYPSEIDAISPATPILFYENPPTASRPFSSSATSNKPVAQKPQVSAIISSGAGGLRVDTGIYRVVYFAFGFEGINNATDRANTMKKIIEWLGTGILPSVPELVSPEDDSIGVCPLTGLSFDWSNSTGAAPITYQIQIDDENGFNLPLIADVSGPSVSNYTYDGTLSASTQYFWRVRASNTYGPSEWSEVWSFTTGTCTTPFFFTVFPHIHDDGTNSNVEISLSNMWNTNTNVWLKAYDNNGIQIGSEQTKTLAPYERWTFSPKVLWGTNIIGSIQVSSNLKLAANMTQIKADNGWAGMTTATDVSTAPTNVIYAHVHDDGTNSVTFIGIRNVGIDTASLTMKFYDNNGTLLSTQYSSVNVNAKYMFYPRLLLGSGFVGSVEVNSTQKIASYVGQRNASSSWLGMMESTNKDTAPTTIVYPHVHDDGTNSVSFIGIRNVGTATANLTMKFYDNNGNLLSTQYATVGVNAKNMFYPRILLGYGISGSVEISSTQPIAGYMGQRKADSSWLGMMPGTNKAYAPTHVFFSNIQDNSTIVTFIGIRNAGAATASLTIKFYDNAGTLVDTKSATVNVDAKYVFYPKVLLGYDFVGSVEIISDQPFAVYAGQRNATSTWLDMMSGGVV